MIIVEDRIREIINTMPPVNYDGVDYPVIFDFGNENDLNKFIRQEDKKYPLIWLQTGFMEDISQSHYVSTDLSFIIATYSGDINKNNSQRLIDTFGNILIPLMENLDKAFTRSNTVLFSRPNRKITKFYNYGNGMKHTSTDIWDAIRFDVEVIINDNCFKAFSYG